jgi:hypothetical protein
MGRSRILIAGLGWLLMAGLTGAQATPVSKADGHARVCCPPGQQDCQVGPDAHICWPEARQCPEAGSSRDFPKCRPNQKWCQVSLDDYICWPVSKPCPTPKARGRIECESGWKKCAVAGGNEICVPEGDECPDSELSKP